DVRALLERTEPSSSISGAQDFSSGYALGYFVASRIVERGGLQRLREMCEQASTRGESCVPVDELLAAAELRADPAGWWPLIAPRLQPADVRAAAEFWSPSLAEVLRLMLPEPGAAAARVRAGDVELRLGEAHAELSASPGLLSGLR